MKQIKTRNLKLNLTKESLKLLSTEQLGTIQGGRPRDTLSCVNLCISINACNA